MGEVRTFGNFDEWIAEHDKEIRADERKKVLNDVRNVLADEIWNRPNTQYDRMYNHCIRRCIALVNRMKKEQKGEQK